MIKETYPTSSIEQAPVAMRPYQDLPLGGQKVVVIGGTGRTGSMLTALLLERGCTVRVLARSASKAARLFQAGTAYPISFLYPHRAGGASHEATSPIISPTGSTSGVVGTVQVVEGTVNDLEALKCLLGGVQGVLIATGSLSPLGIFNQSNSPYVVDYLGMQHILAVLRGQDSQSTATAAASISVPVVLVSTVGLNQPHRLVSMALEYLGGEVMKWKGAAEGLLRTSGRPYAIVRAGLLKSNADLNQLPVVNAPQYQHSSQAAAPASYGSATSSGQLYPPTTHQTTTLQSLAPIYSHEPTATTTFATTTAAELSAKRRIFTQPLVVGHGDCIDGLIERADLALLCVELVAALMAQSRMTPSSPSSSMYHNVPKQSTFEVVAASRSKYFGASVGTEHGSVPSNDPLHLMTFIQPEGGPATQSSSVPRTGYTQPKSAESSVYTPTTTSYTTQGPTY